MDTAIKIGTNVYQVTLLNKKLVSMQTLNMMATFRPFIKMAATFRELVPIPLSDIITIHTQLQASKLAQIFFRYS